MKKSVAVLPSLVICCVISTSFPPHSKLLACTTAVISGRVTPDGRPLLWKNRDTTTGRHNEVAIFEDGKYRAVAVVNAGSRKSIWMGVNEAGFCIENSLTNDLKTKAKTSGPGNGGFMKLALQTCRNLDDFKDLLEKTDETGRSTAACFGVIDAEGGAAMFETGPKSFQMFDANDPKVAPNGYVVRSNFSTIGQKLPANPSSDQLTGLYSAARYRQACSRLADRETGKVSLKYMLRNLTRDMSDENGKAYPGTVNGIPSSLPEIIKTDTTISRTTTVSAAVFHGAKPGESPATATMWTILGDPKFSVAVPCWPKMIEVGDALEDERGGELGEVAITLRDWSLIRERDGVYTKGLPGIWADIWPLEDEMIEAVHSARDRWKQSGFSMKEATKLHLGMTERSMKAMEKELHEMKQDALSIPRPKAPEFAPATKTISVAP